MTHELPFELSALSRAERYQSWMMKSVQSDLGERILEVGAGIGSMSRWLPRKHRLILTEADPEMIQILKKNIQQWAMGNTQISVERLKISEDSLFNFADENLDTIVSFNVLEHVEDDFSAIDQFSRILRGSRAQGPRRLVTLVPAHSFAYGGMDKTFSHYRRYSTDRIRQIAKKAAPDATLTIRHMNVVGLMGWIFNGRILGKTEIGEGAIHAVEKLCPYMKAADFFAHSVFRLPLGQSVIFTLKWDPPNRSNAS